MITDQTPAETAGENKVVLLSHTAVSERLNVSKITLWRWGRSGYLPKVHLGGRVWYRADLVERLIRGELIVKFNSEED